MEKIYDGSKRSNWKLILAVIAGLLLLACGGLTCVSVSTYQSTYHAGVTQETALSAEYKNSLDRLTQYYTNSENALHIQDRNADALKTIVRNMVNGGYGGKSDIGQQNNQLYLNIQRSYPELGSIAHIYDQVTSVFIGSFNDYIHEREKLYDMLRVYDNWKKANPFTAPLIKAMGFPSDSLEAPVKPKDPPLVGVAAEQQMKLVILDDKSIKAEQSGELPPIAFPTP